MLDLIRKKQKSFLVKIVFWAIIATFVGTIFLVWGRGSNDGATGDPDTAATVNGTRISYGEYQNAYSNLYRMYQDVYREKFTPALENKLGLRQQALDGLVEQTLLLQEAKRLGLDVSRQELVDSIAEIPVFQENGAFSRERYLQVLNAQRLNPENFETMQKRQMLVEKVRDKLQAGVSVSDDAIVQEYRDRNEKINLAFLRFSPAEFENQVKVTEQALNAYFNEHQEEFRTPEMVSLQYLRFAPDRYASEVTFDEAELQKYYQRHLDLFEIAEQVKAAHILIKVAQDAGTEMKEKKRKQATEILEKARAGEDFVQLAKKYSDDPGSASRGGELGFFPRGAMVAPFEAAAFSLPPGQISDIVESPYGYHIIKVEEHVEPGVKPFAEVVDEVKAGLRAEKAQRLAYEKAMDAYNLNRKEGSLAKAAEANGLKVEETGLFDRQGSADGLGDAPEIVSTSFTLEPGALARPLSLPQGAILFAVKERQESRRPELAEVRDAVEAAFRSEKGRELAQQAAEAAVAEQKTGKKLEDLARQGRQKVEETGLFSRAYGSFVPGIGNSEELAKAAFSLTEGAPAADRFFEEGDSFVVIQLKDREKADMSALDQIQRDQLREALLSKQKSQAIEQQLDQLRSQAEISISPNIASSLQGKNS